MCLAVPARIIAIHEDVAHADDLLYRTATVDFGGVQKRVALSLVTDAVIGDFVLVHAGIAITVVGASEAQETLELLK